MKNTFKLLIFVMTALAVNAQNRTITGIVMDKYDKQPFAGVNVINKNSVKGTQTDFNGLYEIEASTNDTLVFSFVGMLTQEITVGEKSYYNVYLKEDTSMLEEVIVVGYGTAESNYQPSENQLKRQSKRNQIQYQKNNIAQHLQGKVAGVRINKTNGQVGPSTSIQIRGISSLKGNKEPLYIIDGVPIDKQYSEVVGNLKPEQIDKINVYKDGKAKALFGNAARHGCVVITTVKGNYRLENDESYAEINENKFERTSLSPLSTFSIDVDKAAYSNIRRMINNGQTIPVDAVKIEEMINYFSYDYPQPKDVHPFSINTEAVKTPWNTDTKLVRIGLQGKTYENDELPPSNLTFLIDVSGSMSNVNKLPLLKSAFKLLVNQLRDEDRVSIVVYAGAAGVVLNPTSGNNKEKILEALDNLQAGGSTAGGQGIELAYKLAEKNFKKSGNNRVILATDGDFNVGESSDRAMEKLIEEKRKSGVFLSVLGFGYGNLKDSKLETLADKGNGNHAYIDTMQEAQKMFGEEFGGTLFTIAKDVKIQVEFNPVNVQAYRLIGYENRLLADEDFIDDTKDAGELGSGHTVTAIYEVIPVGIKSDYLKEVDELKYTNNSNAGDDSELFTVKLRYKKPDGEKSIEIVHVQRNLISKASSDLKFVSAVALLGMHLRNSQFYNEEPFATIIDLAKEGKGEDKNGYRSEFIRLVESYQGS